MSKTVIRRFKVGCLVLFTFALILLSFTLVKPDSPVETKAVTVDAQVQVEDCLYGDNRAFDSQIQLIYDGKEIVAGDGVLIYPDQTTYIIDDRTFHLNQAGIYTLRYFYNDNEISLVAETQFDIFNTLYAVTASEKSSVYDATKEEQIGENYQSINDNITVTKESALIVRLEDGSKFLYSKPLDLSNKNEEGLASVIRFDPRMFSFSSASNSSYTFDYWIANGMKIRLTDCYDPNIYIEITITTQPSSSNTPLYTYDNPYVRASTNTLPNAGLQLPSTAAVNAQYSTEAFVDGVRGLLFMGNYGTGAGGYTWRNKNTNGIEILFDYDSSRLYSRSTTGGMTKTQLVTEFTNAAYGNLEYQPFTTGEVYLSLEFNDYVTSDAARVDIFSIGQESGDYLVDEDNFSYKDEKKPNIDINFTPTERDFGYVSVGEYFTIPTATSIDVNGCASVDVAVYKNYESAYKTMVGIENGKFKVESSDVYTIEYTASDTYGNVQVETIKVYGVRQADEKNTVNIDIGEKFTVLNAGEEYILPKPIISTLNKASSLRLLIQMECEGKQIQTLADLYGESEINSFFENDCRFVPLYAGEYKFTYQFADNVMNYFGTGVSYTVMCNSSDTINFLEKPLLERYLIKDAEYSFASVKAYNYSTGEPVAVNNVIGYIRFDDGEYIEIEDLGKVKITGTNTAQLKFVCNNVFVESDIATIVDVNYAESRKIKIDKYFVQDDFELVDGSPLIFKTVKTRGDAKISFANSIGYQNLSLKFMMDSGYADYKCLNIVLTEPTDTSKKVTISFYNDTKDNFVVSVNGGKEYIIKDSFSSAVEKQITYNSSSKILTVANCANVILIDFGFSSPTAYLDFECVGLAGVGGLRVNAINNQNIGTNVKRDNKQPEFYDLNSCRGTYAKDSVVAIHPVLYYDVLSPILTSTLSVKVTDTKGNYLTSVDGVVLDGTQNNPNTIYEVKFTEFGEYYVDYSCVDLQGNACSTRSFIVIKDFKKPLLTFMGGITEGGTITVNKGETLLIKYTLTDDTSQGDALECYITVMDLKSHYIYAYHNTNQIAFSYIGKFEVTLTARDAAGNCTVKSFFVVVS